MSKRKASSSPGTGSSLRSTSNNSSSEYIPNSQLVDFVTRVWKYMLSRTWSYRSDGVFVPCDISFYSEVARARRDGMWLQFNHLLPSSTSFASLYIRECYDVIGSQIKALEDAKVIIMSNRQPLVRPRCYRGLISGTPGVGKTCFLFFLLWRFTSLKHRVLFLFESETIYFDSMGSVFVVKGLPHASDSSFWNNELWCLFDGKDKGVSDLNKLPYSKCNFAIATSPRRDLVNDFKKSPLMKQFYVPVWTEVEMCDLAALYGPPVNWRRRFSILGGVPRHVLEISDNDPTEKIRQACMKCDLNDCLKMIDSVSDIDDNCKVLHTLVHIDCKSPFNHSSVRFASKVALDTIMYSKGKVARNQMQEFLCSSAGHVTASAMRGQLFEKHAIETFARGGAFAIRELVHWRTRDKNTPTPKQIILPPSEVKISERISSSHSANKIYVPKSKTFGAIDAWKPQFGAFQITVGTSHSNLSLHTKENQDALGSNTVYWLLPPDTFPRFTKKCPVSIRQFAIEIPIGEIDV